MQVQPQALRTVLDESQASKVIREESQSPRGLPEKLQTFELLLGESQTAITCKNTYVKVKADGSEDIFEFLTNNSGDLEISALADVFQGKYVTRCFGLKSEFCFFR